MSQNSIIQLLKCFENPIGLSISVTSWGSLFRDVMS